MPQLESREEIAAKHAAELVTEANREVLARLQDAEAQLDRLLEAVEEHRDEIGSRNHSPLDEALYDTAEEIRKEREDD